MMKNFIPFLFLYLFLSSSSFSQNKFFINGVIGVQGGEMYSYDLELQSTDNPNEYTGIAKTYAFINKEVTADIKFTVDRSNKTARLKETKIISNNGFQSTTTICLVDAALTYDDQNGVLKGSLITQTSRDAVYCAFGQITFTSSHEIRRIFNITAPEAAVPDVPERQAARPSQATPASTVQARPHTPPVSSTTTPTAVQNHTPPPAAAPIQQVTHGKDAEITWHSDKITMHIWDDNKVDGDRVSVMYNGQEVLTNYMITSEPKMLEFDIGGSELNIITIVAMSEGSEPSNTAMIRLFDADRKPHDIVSHNDAGKKSMIRIRKAR